MIKLVLTFRKRSDLTREAFLRYWREEHIPLVLQVPHIQRYVISPVAESLDREHPPYDGMAELWFETRQDLDEAMRSEETEATAIDGRNFIEKGTIDRVLCEEEEVVRQEAKR